MHAASPHDDPPMPPPPPNEMQHASPPMQSSGPSHVTVAPVQSASAVHIAEPIMPPNIAQQSSSASHVIPIQSTPGAPASNVDRPASVSDIMPASDPGNGRPA